MTVFIAQSKDGQLKLSEFNAARFRDWLKKNPNKWIRIEPDEPPTFSLRKFFEGPVVQYYFYQHNVGVFRDFRDARESLKREFNPEWIINAKGEREMVGGSTAKRSKQWWIVFLQRIEQYFLQNGYEFPISKEYDNWLKSAPNVDEIFPPLLRLIDTYKKQI